jgi:hypothetical protein
MTTPYNSERQKTPGRVVISGQWQQETGEGLGL